LEYVGIFWSTLEYFGISWNTLENFGIHWNILEYLGICLEYFEISWNILEYLKIWISRDSAGLHRPTCCSAGHSGHFHVGALAAVCRVRRRRWRWGCRWPPPIAALPSQDLRAFVEFRLILWRY
jgi:hypothetical protein